MENLDKKQCECGMHSAGSMMDCHGCHGGKHHLIKIILKLVILIIIFWCGFKLGEITGYIKSASRSQDSGFRMIDRSNFELPLPTPAPANQ